MATCTELYIDTLGGLDLDGSTEKNLPYFVVENLAALHIAISYRDDIRSLCDRALVAIRLSFRLRHCLAKLLPKSIGYDRRVRFREL